MNLKVIGTGSTGNSYLFYDNKISFIIDAGVSFSEILNNIPHNTEFKGVFLTHEHSDHSKSISKCIKYGLNIFCSNGTATALKLNKWNYRQISEMDSIYDAKNKLEIIPIKISHNANQPLGFFISYKGINTLFATDCNKIYGRFSSVTNFIIEGNHSLDLMDRDMVNFNAYNNHMSIESAAKFVEKYKSIETKQIILIHLSRRNSNPEKFKEIMIKETGIETFIAKNNSKFNLNGYF